MPYALLMLILSIVENISAAAPALAAAAKRDKELTPEQEAELDARMARAFTSPAWQPDSTQ